MAPDISDKKTKVCKKYSHSDHSKYKQWEKDRRDRFNVKLEELASCLPSYSKENPWKKVEIVENAIVNLRSLANDLQAKNNSDRETIRKLSAEVNSLKDIILQFTSFKKSSEDIYKLTSEEIVTAIKQIIFSRKRDAISSGDTETDAGDDNTDDTVDEDLAFVAKIAQTNDHCYSVSVTEPNMRVETEEVVETEDVAGSGQQTLIPIQEFVTVLPTPAPSDTYITLVPDTNPGSNMPQIINIDDMSALAGVRTIFVNKGSKTSVMCQQPPPVPVVPDLVASELGKVAIPRLRAQKRAKKVRKVYTRKKPFVKSCKKSSVLKSLEENSDHNVSSETIFSDDPLTNKEEMEIIEETIKEDTEQTEKFAMIKEKSKGGSKGSKENNKKKLEGLGKKKSKSSYSIAALCQISVNIGDNRPEVAQSPGLMSLASVGTISPANTPGPGDKTPGLALETCLVMEPGTGASVEETVIEELRTIRPEDLQQIEVVTSSVSVPAPELSASLASSSGGKQPPVGCEAKTIQKDIYQVIKDLDQELDLEKENFDSSVENSNSAARAIVKEKASIQCIPAACAVSKEKTIIQNIPVSKNPVKSSSTEHHVVTVTSAVSRSVQTTTNTAVRKAITTTSASSMSVYDFQASKPETPPIPLQESRKDNKSSQKSLAPLIDQTKSFAEKKTYTELHSKQKKATGAEVSPKKSYVDTRKDGPASSQIMASSHVHTASGYGQANFNLMDPAGYHQHQEIQQRLRPSNSNSSNYSGSGYPGPSRHSGYVSGYPGYQPSSSQHHHSYHQPYNQPGESTAEMKQFHQSPSKYPVCGAHSGGGTYLHSDFHSRSYYPGGAGASKPYTNQTYRHFHSEDSGQHYGDRKRTGQQMEIGNQPMASLSPEKIQSSSSGTFSVTHLVNTNQRKGTKRSSSSTNKASKAAKSDLVKEAKTEKEECRKPGRSQSSRRNKSGTRSNYSAESLISGAGAGSTQTITMGHQVENKIKLATTPGKSSVSQKYPSTDIKTSSYHSSIKTSSNWTNDGSHFSGLQLSSPSPANILPTDLSSIDFQMSIFGQQDTNLNPKDYLTGSSSSQAVKTGGKQPGAACQISQQRSGVPDWSLNPGMLETSFPPIMPIMTPPSDPMTGYPFMSDPMSHSATSWYPCSAAQTSSSSRTHNQTVSYSSNIPVSGYTQTKAASAASHSLAPSQMVPLPPLAGPNPQTGSLLNFNLSTIFPDIITPGVVSGQAPVNCQGRSGSGQLGAAGSDLLPHSFALLGHSSQVVPPTFSVASNMAPPPLTFTNE